MDPWGRLYMYLCMNGRFCMVHVGKYTIPMDGMGYTKYTNRVPANPC